MHYANGRPAQNGDKVVQIVYGGPVLGVLHSAVPGNDYCNGSLAPILGTGGACLADCVHIDDVLKALGVAPGADVRAALAKVPRSDAT